MFFFLPLGTTRPRWRRPNATYLLIVANVFVLWLQLLYPDAMPEGYVPGHPRLLAWFASMFMHSGAVHLAGNMLFLWLFASLTEDVFGPRMLLGVYLAANLGATLLNTFMGVLFAPAGLGVPVLGASGAIAGIMGLSSVCFWRTKVRIWYLLWLYLYVKTEVVEIAAPVFLGLWVAWEVVQGVFWTALEHFQMGAGGVAHWAHVGGFAVGVGAALAFNLRQRLVRSDMTEERRPPETSYEAYAYAAELVQVTRTSPEDAEAWYALARANELSHKPHKAGPAYARALELFVRQRKEDQAVRAYRGMKEFADVSAIPAELRFPLACALDERGLKEDAFRLFWESAQEGQSTHGETALVRAGEIARSLPGMQQQARDCYERLLAQYPYGPWRSLARDRLEQFGKPGVTHGPLGATHPATQPQDQDLRHLGGSSEQSES